MKRSMVSNNKLKDDIIYIEKRGGEFSYIWSTSVPEIDKGQNRVQGPNVFT